MKDDAVRASFSDPVVSMTSPSLISAASSGYYVHVGVFTISVTNLLIIVAMIVVFVLGLVLPFPGSSGTDAHGGDRP
jgi:hypothetical protein